MFIQFVTISCNANTVLYILNIIIMFYVTIINCFFNSYKDLMFSDQNLLQHYFFSKINNLFLSDSIVCLFVLADNLFSMAIQMFI